MRNTILVLFLFFSKIIVAQTCPVVPTDITFCGGTSVKAYVNGIGEYNWYTAATGGTQIATSSGNNLTADIPFANITQVSGGAPYRVYTVYAEDAKLYPTTTNTRPTPSIFSDFRGVTQDEIRLYFSTQKAIILDGLTVKYVCYSAGSSIKLNVYNATTNALAGSYSTTVTCTSSGTTIDITGMNINLPVGSYYMDAVGSSAGLDIGWTQTGAAYPDQYAVNSENVISFTGVHPSMSWAPKSSPAFYNFKVITKI